MRRRGLQQPIWVVLGITWLQLSVLLCAWQNPSRATIGGRVECVDAQGRTAGASEACAPSSRFVLRAASGQSYFLLPTDEKAGIFKETRVRIRPVEIDARILPGNRIELIKVYSLLGEKLHEVYYRCDICNIRAYAPGPCWCCQQDFEFRETPLAEP